MNLRIGRSRKDKDTFGGYHFQPLPRTQEWGEHRQRDGGAIVEDEIMKLVRRVFICTDIEKTPAIVAFCGVDEGAGCSWVCARAAEVLAEQVPGNVCLLDANLRSPSLHSRFRVENGPGFSDAIRGSEPIREFAQRIGKVNLRLITAGATGKEPNGALNPARLRTRFSELRSEFEFVLVDTPATSTYADAMLLSQLTDGVVLVVGSNSTRRESARAAKRSFETAKVPLFGAVLNKRTYPIPEALYWKL
jgi:Mrp family chromosome partitioning ATPase